MRTSLKDLIHEEFTSQLLKTPLIPEVKVDPRERK
jgi:hypothetical protein